MKFLKAAFVLCLGLCGLASPVLAQGNPQLLNTAGIAKAFGKEGDRSGEMYKVSFPRSDLTVKIGNLVIKPALALTSWAAFLKTGRTAMAYGDIVLVADEVNPVISKLEERGIGIAALHNHLLHENPAVMYIHFIGYGDEVAMAAGIREAVALTKTPLAAAAPAGPETKPELAKEIERIIGHEGAMGGGVFHIIVPRNEVHVAAMHADIPGSMAVAQPGTKSISAPKLSAKAAMPARIKRPRLRAKNMGDWIPFLGGPIPFMPCLLFLQLMHGKQFVNDAALGPASLPEYRRSAILKPAVK